MVNRAALCTETVPTSAGSPSAMAMLHQVSDWLAQLVPGLPGGLAALAALSLLAGLLAGLLLAWLLAPPSPVVLAAPNPEESLAAIALRAELVEARAAAARQLHDAEASAQALSDALVGVLGGLSEAAERSRTAAADSAGHADALVAAVQAASDDSATIATTLSDLAAHGETLAGAVHEVAGALAAVAEALGPSEREEGVVAGSSLVDTARACASATADLAMALRAAAGTGAQVQARIATMRDVAEAGGDSAQVMARASDAVGHGAIAAGLEFATFLDGLARAGNRRRFDRYPTHLAARLAASDQDGGREWRVTVVDISRGGCAIDRDPGVPEGAELALTLPGLEAPLQVRLARRLGSIAGLAFLADDPLAGRLEQLVVAPAAAA